MYFDASNKKDVITLTWGQSKNETVRVLLVRTLKERISRKPGNRLNDSQTLQH